MTSAIIHIKDHQIINGKAFDNLFAPLENGRYEVKVTKANNRSLSQNAYLHGVVIPLVFDGLKDAGFDEVRTHEDAKVIIKELFLKHPVTNGSETFQVTKGTHQLSTVEMMAFVADVQRWASEYLGVIIPDPGQKMEMDFKG